MYLLTNRVMSREPFQNLGIMFSVTPIKSVMIRGSKVVGLLHLAEVKVIWVIVAAASNRAT